MKVKNKGKNPGPTPPSWVGEDITCPRCGFAGTLEAHDGGKIHTIAGTAREFGDTAPVTIEYRYCDTCGHAIRHTYTPEPPAWEKAERERAQARAQELAQAAQALGADGNAPGLAQGPGEAARQEIEARAHLAADAPPALGTAPEPPPPAEPIGTAPAGPPPIAPLGEPEPPRPATKAPRK